MPKGDETDTPLIYAETAYIASSYGARQADSSQTKQAAASQRQEIPEIKEQPKRRIQSMEEWRNSPDNPRNNPKISPEENQRIIDEILAHGHIWEVQEKINARRLVEPRENRFDQN